MRILYLCYDGLTDFIGQSQVLPYLEGCAKAGYSLTVITFEKPERFVALRDMVQSRCDNLGIVWLPQPFRTSPPYLAKLIDQRRMLRVATLVAATAREGSFDIVHCRSYPAAVAGVKIKRRFGGQLVFDMRGFWPDTRREGGRWPQSSVMGRILYRRWKMHEAAIIAEANHIITLTNAARKEIRGWPTYRGAPISVIPCCADFEHFQPSTDERRRAVRIELGWATDTPVLVYLGSLGTIYLTDQHLKLFERVRQLVPGSRLLFIGRDAPEVIVTEARRQGIALHESEFRVVKSERDKIPYWLGAGDVGTCFAIPTFSSLGMSPTKLGEYLACGLPVIANAGIGDVGPILSKVNGGYLMPHLSASNIESAAHAFIRLRAFDRLALRERAKSLLDLPKAVAAYCAIYDDPAIAICLGDVS